MVTIAKAAYNFINVRIAGTLQLDLRSLHLINPKEMSKSCSVLHGAPLGREMSIHKAASQKDNTTEKSSTWNEVSQPTETSLVKPINCWQTTVD